MLTLVTGATGFVGRHLLAQLDGPVHVLSRDAERAKKSLDAFDVKAFEWDAKTGQPPPPEALEGVDAVFNLAGESIAEGRWTEEKKRRIRDSRVDGTRLLVEGIGKLDRKPSVLVSGSAVGYYGDRGDQELSESSGPGEGFLVDVCREWETEAERAEALSVRVVTPRIGIVLGADGGAMEKMLPIFRWGLGGKLGSGKQYFPWVHVEDLVRLFVFAAMHDALRGPVNATAPHPVTNADFTKAVGAAINRPTFFGVPEFALKTVAGEMGDMLLHSQRVVPAKALAAGFTFRYPTLDEALAQIVSDD